MNKKIVLQTIGICTAFFLLNVIGVLSIFIRQSANLGILITPIIVLCFSYIIAQAFPLTFIKNLSIFSWSLVGLQFVVLLVYAFGDLCEGKGGSRVDVYCLPNGEPGMFFGVLAWLLVYLMFVAFLTNIVFLITKKIKQ